MQEFLNESEWADKSADGTAEDDSEGQNKA